MATKTAYRTCPLCEATCGLEIEIRDDAVTRIRGDREDVFSRGFVCPKGSTLKQLHEDPDRVRRPLVKREGAFVEVPWDEAWQVVDDGLRRVITLHGRESLGIYVGNPNAHNLGGMLYLRPLIKALGTRNVFSASTVDQRPKEIACGLLFGSFMIPVPDLDRTDFLLCIGANPLVSNGSVATAPNWPGRLRDIVDRGGEVIVVDPRRTATAAMATEWLPIRPGTDALLLAAMANVVLADGLADLGRLGEFVNGIDDLRAALGDLTPECVAGTTGIAADRIRGLAHRIAAAPAAAVYARVGTTTQRFGSLTSWLVEALNVLTGNLDRAGGVMLSLPATGAASSRGPGRYGRGVQLHRWHSRVRRLPETMGELPVAALAEELDTPGPGQIRGLVTVAGNPVVSTPNAGRLDDALTGLEFMVAVDIYVNETTRHADVILPVPSALQKAHYDLVLSHVALRNVAKWSNPVLPLDDDQPDEWEVLARLALAAGAGPPGDPAVVDDQLCAELMKHAPSDVVAAVNATGRRGPERLVDVMLRLGPYGLTLDDLLAHPHGVDLGPLQERLPDALRTPSGCIELAPPELLAELPRLIAMLDEPVPTHVLIGRRDLRSNNSWMHNLDVLVRGKPRCTMLIHPEDAAMLGLTDGAAARVSSRVGEITVPVEITDDMTPGVVSIPHGWGHGAPGTQLAVAARHAGVNTNLLTDEQGLDALTGTAALTGTPVSIRPDVRHARRRPREGP